VQSLRRAGFPGISVAIGLLLGLGAMEGVVRVFSLASPLQPVFANYVTDPNLPFRPRPLSRNTGHTAEFAYDYRHNSLGFRDQEHEFAKQPGVVRILGLGDSFTYGVGAAYDETWLSRLQTMLDARRGPYGEVEVIRGGIPRYFPETERILLEHDGVRFHPDLILVGVLPNDVVDTHFGLDAVTTDSTGYLRTREAKLLGRWGVLIYRYSHLGRLVLRVYIEGTSRLKEDRFFLDGGPYEQDWTKMEREFGRMAAVADSIGAKLLLIHIPQKGPWSEQSRYLPARLSAWAARNGVLFLDVLPAMQRQPNPERLYYPDDGHCTPTGYEVIADTVFQYLTDRKLVP